VLILRITRVLNFVPLRRLQKTHWAMDQIQKASSSKRDTLSS